MKMTPRKKGRPLSFDRDIALQKAMMLFWQHGYEATSLNDLTTALEVTPSSIYSAFGDKKGLFLNAVALYLSGPVTSGTIINEAATAHEAALGLLNAAAIGFTGKDTPAGCLLASSAISCSVAADDVKVELAKIRHGIETQLREKITSSIKSKQMPAETDAEGLAALTMSIIQGMSTLARDGAPREKLLKVVETAMKIWP
ncbi:TetR/AcrR family transcriptional regulator [Undibacterium sp. TC4M20W]|uniref:TetR/AcrR family transcriptional regulator n=1 Tax=Undibacterium sp. TC4M20W TaxID=3413052 RepID=UPI003BF11D50